MPLSLDRLLIGEAEQQLAAEVVQWLQEVPARKDIFAYMSKLPEELQQPMADYATNLLIEHLSEEKFAYLDSINAKEFYSQLPENEQLSWLSLFAEYSASSVVKNLAKQYPDLGSLQLDKAFSAWARFFINRLTAGVTFGVSTDYSTVIYYATALMRSLPDYTVLSVLENELALQAEAMQDRYLNYREMTLAEKEEEMRVLKKLVFIPQASIETIGSQGDTPEKGELFTDLLLAIHNLQGFQKEVPKLGDIPAAQLEDRVLVTLYFTVKPQILTRFEQLRRGKVPVLLPSSHLADKLEEIWTVDNLQNETIAKQINELFTQATPQEKEVFEQTVNEFISDTALGDVILDPFSMEQILHMVRSMPDRGTLFSTAEDLAKELKNPEYKEYFNKLLTELFTITHSLRSAPVSESAPALQPVIFTN